MRTEKSKSKTKLISKFTSLDEKYQLYQSSVQNVKKEIEFFRKIYRLIYNNIAYTFREYFCGKGLLSCEWVKNNVMNTAVGIDYDDEPLDWGVKNNVKMLNSGEDRVKLIKQNVLEKFNDTKDFEIIC